jgi:hypothetical protein
MVPTYLVGELIAKLLHNWGCWIVHFSIWYDNRTPRLKKGFFNCSLNQTKYV